MKLSSNSRYIIIKVAAIRRLPVILLPLVMFLSMAFVPGKASALSVESFALDSIAAWGKFPRFCVGVYRWGDKFFNTYDSTYVQGSGERWDVKLKTDSWLDVYDFRLVDGYRMEMASRPSTTLGVYLTYMAVSVGYDLHLSRYFRGEERSRRRFNFQFNCSLFALEFQSMSNDIGTIIHRIGMPDEIERVDIPFKGINTSQWQLDMYYFFNHKHYSQAAAFYYSKIQTKSSGSLYAGLSFSKQKYKFDFSSLENELFKQIPQTWNYYYNVENMNYALRIGYAYNWVFLKGWNFGISASPILGLRHGAVNRPGERGWSFAMSNQIRGSIVYNLKKKWFFGIVGRWDAGLIYDKEHSMLASTVIGEFSAGFRFDLW